MSERYFFTDKEGKILGPRPVQEIRTFFESGYLEPTAEVCREGEEKWQSLPVFLKETASQVELTQAPFVAEPTAREPAVNPPSSSSASGLALRVLLTELKDRSLTLVVLSEALGAASLETVGEDVLTLSVPSTNEILHLPLARLCAIREHTETSETTLVFA